MARRPDPTFRPPTPKKIKPNNNKVKFNLKKATPEIITLNTFGIKIINPKIAEKVFNEIMSVSKSTGKEPSLVAKEFRKNLTNKKK